jgi:hypothetical protein
MLELVKSTPEVNQNWPAHILAHYVCTDNADKPQKIMLPLKINIFNFFMTSINAPEILMRGC